MDEEATSTAQREAEPGGERGAPRWVRVFAIVTAVLIALLVTVMLFGGHHGPGRHLSLAVVADGLAHGSSHSHVAASAGEALAVVRQAP